MSLQLHLELRNQLALTPQLRQAIQILQYSMNEMAEFIEEQLLENPVLERKERRTINTSLSWVEQIGKQETTLFEYLEQQLRWLSLDKLTEQRCLYLLGNLNEQGYLDLDEELCNRFRDFDRCLGIIQSLEPAGIGARNLVECLILQLTHKEQENELAVRIIQNFLEELSRGEFSDIAAICKVPIENVLQAVAEIKALYPYPGTLFTNQAVPRMEPDVLVRKENGEYQIMLMESDFSMLRVSDVYSIQRMREEDDQVKKYVKERIQSALWLIRAIEQRKNTIKNVVTTLINKQHAFFEKGPEYLIPLTLKQIADEIKMHESTVSRAVKNKYLQTSFGVFSFRSLFPSGIDKQYTTQQVKKKISTYVQQESRRAPVSDQNICSLLKKEGIDISRRTVAKYREEMGIGSSQQRRK